MLVDRTLTGNITASVTLQSTNSQELRVPGELVKKILDHDNIVSIILTNQERCGVLGVSDAGCILVNTARTVADPNIFLIQDIARETGDMVIDDLNSLFDTQATYHSIYLHHRDEANTLLGTSGSVSGRDVVSTIYVMPKEDTHSMYAKISGLMIAPQIRNSGGFFDAAISLSSYPDSNMAFSIIPLANNTLYQLRVSAQYPDVHETDTLSILDYLNVDSIRRSAYFDDGFYPLNSLFHLVILSPQPLEIHHVNAGIIPSSVIDNQTIPTAFDKRGWVFDSESGTKIEGKYLFGTTMSADPADLMLTVGAPRTDDPALESLGTDGYIIVAAIVAASVAASVFYFKGYKKSSNSA